MLEIKDLVVKIDGKVILNGINLSIKKGETHVIMGPNGSGKSTLSKALLKHPDCEIVSGSVVFNGNDITGMDSEVIARLGIFLGFQYPVEVPGITNETLLREALNQLRKEQGEKLLDPVDFRPLLQEKLQRLGMNEDFITRGVNVGFSGGEKKKNEILQMLMLNPRLAILDETDSGLDVDSLKTVCEGVNTFRGKDNAVILITHYNTILNHIHPDVVHILKDGKVVKTGGRDLAQRIEREGFANV